MMDRRQFLHTSLTFTAAGLAWTGLAAQETPPAKKNDWKKLIANGGEEPEKHLTCYPDTLDGKHQLYQLWVSQNNSTLLSYRAHQDQKYPFFSPLTGPLSGLPLTTETGRPWPHHRAVFFGCDRVNGGNYWQDSLGRGQIISQGPSFAKKDGQFELSPNSAVIVDRCLWQQGKNDPIIEDRRRFTVKILDERRYILDADIVMKALTDITITQTNHGLFGVRCAPDLAPTGGGVLESSEGAKGMKDTLGKPAKWMAFYGRRAKLKEEITEGIAVFCPSKAPHPVFEKCPWFTRDYGNISPTPMNWLTKEKPFTLPKGEELHLRYRVAAFGGTPKDADLNGLWEEFDQQG